MAHNAAADKQIDSMTDKVADREEVAVSGASVENLQSDTPTTFLIPS